MAEFFISAELSGIMTTATVVADTEQDAVQDFWAKAKSEGHLTAEKLRVKQVPMFISRAESRRWWLQQEKK